MGKYVEMNLADVTIPSEFQKHPPRNEKIEAKKSEFSENGKLSRGMAVTSDGVLIDGYAAFLALRQLGEISFRFKIRDKATVVDARHATNPSKLYRWRSNHGTTGKSRFKRGDHIAVRTRYGVREVVVESVQKIPAEEALGLGIVIGRWDPDMAATGKDVHNDRV